MGAYLALGSNLGDRLAHLRRAVARLRALDGAARASPVYETAPVGGPAGQGPYLNCVVRLEGDHAPEVLLGLAHELEADAGRVRAERFGPRTLDVDVLLVDGYASDDPVLTVPHPRMTERAFVLAPLEDLDARAVPDRWRDALGGEGALAGALRCLGELLATGERPGGGT